MNVWHWVILVFVMTLPLTSSCSSSQRGGRTSNRAVSHEVGTSPVDRDGDGLVDDDDQSFGDVGTSAPRPLSSDGEICGDGEDNDGDLDVDCDDVDCSVLPACQRDDRADGVDGE